MLADVPPVFHELIYANTRARLRAVLHAQPHAQPLLRAGAAGRQGGATGRTTRSGTSCAARLDPEARERLVTGPSLEKSIAPLRSFVAEPMRFGRLFLAGDAAHIVPPTGAKGLNLAASDVKYLASGLVEHYREHSGAGLDHYSDRALRRIWKAERFSWWFTIADAQVPGTATSTARCRRPSWTTWSIRNAASTALAENYVGLRL